MIDQKAILVTVVSFGQAMIEPLMKMLVFTRPCPLLNFCLLQVNLPKTDNSEPGFAEADSSKQTTLKVTLPSRSSKQSSTSKSAQQHSTRDKLLEEKLPSSSTLKAQSAQEEKETEWPVFFDGEKLLPTAFKEDL